MRVSLIKNKKIQNILLPNKVEGSYWINDIDSNGIKRNLISIEADNNNWKIMSNKEVYYVEDKCIKPYGILENYHFYSLRNSVENTNLIIYCSPINAKYSYYDISSILNTGVKIGSNNDCIIKYNLLGENDAIIKKENDKIYIIDDNSKYGIYVNNVRVNNKKEIKIGDNIFIMGLKMIYLSKKTNKGMANYICVNNSSNITIDQLFPININEGEDINYQEAEEEMLFPLYDEKEYFHKVPRFINKIETLELNVDAPPAMQEEQENSVLLTFGPMLTMSLTSLMTGYSAISNVSDGTMTWKKAMPSLVICGAMFASIFLWPLFTKAFQKRQKIKKEKERQKKYSAYIEEKRQIIIETKEKQENILKNNYANTKYSEEVVLNRYTSLWQRRIKDDDYLKLNLGNGTYPMKIDIKYPEDHFSMVEDNLKDMVSKLGNEPKLLENVPVVLSLFEKYISGIIGDSQVIGEYVRRLLIQILAFHSYDTLKIIVLTDEENEYQWKFLKDCPHCFTDDKNLRFFATNNDEYKEVCYYLNRVFNSTKETTGSGTLNRDNMNKTYLIITDCFKNVRDFDVIKNILNEKDNLGFSLMVLDNKIINLPDQCQIFVQIYNNNLGELTNNENILETVKFNIDLTSDIDYENCIRAISNVPIEIDSDEEGQLPNKIGFLEMYDVGKVEQFNSLTRWKKNNPILNLQVPVGIGKNGEKISIDLHEKYHGPHGLIAGMTGSGKSEFIISYILSMAINYHPYEVQFILIDYKGGGLAGAFENKSTGLKLPHLVGTITNLDANEINRSLASIESELKRRQALFNKAREISEESTIDIYKYQKMYREKLVDEPISHLFIISDEFAELKSQQPEFMSQLISTARIGRSLGVHLILATQKPSGVVDPQIWSNTRFRVCLRVQEKSDSNEVIKCPDAAFLKQTGRFYFQVGYNETFALGQAAWAGGKYIPAEKVQKSLDTSINFIDNIGYQIKNIETKPKKEAVKAQGEELGNIVKYLNNLALEQNIKCKPLWLEKMASFIKLDGLLEKYNYKQDKFIINPIIGEYDVPSRQEQKLLTLPFSKEGNATIYGASGSGKENLITTILYSSMVSYTPEEINYYIIDCGSESLKMFKNSPIIGDILTIDDEDKINNLFKLLQTTIEERKNMFSEYNGDYYNYCMNSGKSVPNIIVIINNYEAYQETYTQYDDILVGLSRECIKYGIYFLLTLNTPNGMRFKLRQNFALTYALQQNNLDDYTTILGNVHKTYPDKKFGRGIIKIDDIYEFQTALVDEKDNIPNFIKDKCLEYQNKYKAKANAIPVLPEVVTYANIASEFGKDDSLVVGIEKETLDINKYDFYKNYTTVVSMLDIMSSNNFINPLINQILGTNKSKLVVINVENDYHIDDKYKKYYQYIDNNFDTIFTSLNDFINQQVELYKQNNFNKDIFNGKKRIDCIIIGIDSFKNRLSDENKQKFADLFNNAKDLGVIDFIIVDSVDKIKKMELDSWYKNCINNNNGIWIGNGINDQYSLKITQRISAMKEEVPNYFCFVINRGKPILVKYVSKLDLNIK